MAAGLSAQSLVAQVCRLSVGGLNRNRKVVGQIHAECPEEVVHSAPFGNWGVTSNYASKHDSHQFDGWCHNSYTCDNTGFCRTDCQDGWYEWNSCTDHPLYNAPNCTLFNADNCTDQVTTTGVNVHGTKTVDISVSCPTDLNGDGVPDSGGCKDVEQYTSDTNFMSVYELDPICCDELVQTVYFPRTTVTLSCDVFGCAPAGSNWVLPSAWDSPYTPAKVFAEIATAVNWGALVDPSRACKISVTAPGMVSAASFVGPAIASGSIASAFGNNLAAVTLAAGSTTLPESLGGTAIRVVDSVGVSRLAPLYFVSPGQVNFIVPSGSTPGSASLTVFRGDIPIETGHFQIDRIAPGLFSENANGTGVAAAVVLRIGPAGTQVEYVFECGPTPGSCVPKPIARQQPGEQMFLVLFGTGISNNTDLTNVAVTVGGEHMKITYAGPQRQYPGMDQVNVELTPQLAGRQTVDVVLTVASKPANTVTISFQ